MSPLIGPKHNPRPQTLYSWIHSFPSIPNSVITSSAFSRCVMPTPGKSTQSHPFLSISHQAPKCIPIYPLPSILKGASLTHTTVCLFFTLCLLQKPLLSSMVASYLVCWLPPVPMWCVPPSTTSTVLGVNCELDRAGFLFEIPQWLPVALRKDKSKPLDNLPPGFPL